MKKSKMWYMTFENSGLLSKDGTETVQYFEDAMEFATQDAGLEYLHNNLDKLTKLGENPMPSREK